MAAARKAKKATKTKSSRKKPTAKRKRSKVTKPAAKKKATARRKSKSASTYMSVDSILAKFSKRRAEQESKLATARKKIVQLEKRIKASQAEIVSLKAAESKAETAIGKLDLDRDQDVRKLLDKLGVQLVTEAATQTAKKKPENSKTRKAKKKPSETQSRDKSPAPKTASQTDDAPMIQKKPLFDTVFRSPTTSNGNPPRELPASSSSDELLDEDDESLDGDHNESSD